MVKKSVEQEPESSNIEDALPAMLPDEESDDLEEVKQVLDKLEALVSKRSHLDETFHRLSIYLKYLHEYIQKRDNSGKEVLARLITDLSAIEACQRKKELPPTYLRYSEDEIKQLEMLKEILKKYIPMKDLVRYITNKSHHQNI